MIIIFILLILLGGVQIMLWRRQHQRVHPLLQASRSVRRNALSWLYYQQIARFSTLWLRQLVLYLLGDKKNRWLLKNGAILFGVLIAGAYLNQNYLQTSLYLLLPILTLVTLMALYHYRKKQRRLAFEEEFAEALNIISSAVRSGHSATEGIKDSSDKLQGLVGDEFRQISQRLDIGEEPQKVFMASYNRLNYQEYYFFITAIMINLKGGGQLREIMTRLGQMINSGRIIERQKMAKTSELRMSVKILVIIPIGFFIFMRYMMPDSFDLLLNTPAGRNMLYYAIGSIIAGLIIIRIMMGRI